LHDNVEPESVQPVGVRYRMACGVSAATTVASVIPSTLTTLRRLESPDMTRTLDLAMSSLSAMKATNAAFAAPSTGGAARRIRTRPSCMPEISVLLARG